MDPDSELVFDFPPFLRLYKSGRVERLIDTGFVTAGVDPATGVASKDVSIDLRTGLSARLYLPCPSASDSGKRRLPILLYTHGGAFVIESAFSPTYHAFLNNLVARADIIAVSVEYRRAPEHPLPAAFDDAFSALQWVAAHAGGDGPEAWLAERGDFGRVFLAGDSAGGNIAHNILVRAQTEGLQNEVMKIKGLALIHVYFWGKDPVGSEPTDPEFRQWLETTWGFVNAWSAGIEDPKVDPFRDEAILKGLCCQRILVSVTEIDWFRERGKAYYRKLKESGWGGEAELVETADEEHVYFLSKPNCEKASVEIGRLARFFTRD